MAPGFGSGSLAFGEQQPPQRRVKAGRCPSSIPGFGWATFEVSSRYSFKILQIQEGGEISQDFLAWSMNLTSFCFRMF
jgi:hypothetical protein